MERRRSDGHDVSRRAIAAIFGGIGRRIW
jgi:hypothetical protein